MRGGVNMILILTFSAKNRSAEDFHKSVTKNNGIVKKFFGITCEGNYLLCRVQIVLEKQDAFVSDEVFCLASYVRFFEFKKALYRYFCVTQVVNSYHRCCGSGSVKKNWVRIETEIRQKKCFKFVWVYSDITSIKLTKENYNVLRTK